MPDSPTTDDEQQLRPAQRLPWEEFREAPLTPIAIAVCLGIFANQHLRIAVEASLTFAVLAGIATCWLRQRYTMLGLALCSAALAASHHQYYLQEFPRDDVGALLIDGPALLKVRAILDEDPVPRLANPNDLTAKFRSRSQDLVLIQLKEIQLENGQWSTASGLVRLTIDHEDNAFQREILGTLQAGDEVEFLGRFWLPRPPGNPGERSQVDWLEARRIRAEALVLGSNSLVRLDRSQGYDYSWAGLRRQFTRLIQNRISQQESPTARALLLGDGSAMQRAEWDAYIRTGVIHALAISGQHLAILAAFLWFVLDLFQVPRARGAWIVLLIILSYTILTGLRPSGIRAAVMVGVICGAIILRRRPHLANSFALAIIAVLIFNPTDLFNLGCQLSFLCVFVLLWGIRRWFAPQPLTPLDRLIADARPTWLARTLQLWHVLQMAYFTTILLGLVTTPLLLKEYNLITLGGIVIGPPIVLLTSVALVAGFLLMLLGGVFEPLGAPFALLAEWSLRLASSLVKITDAIPYTSVHFPTLPDWWTWLFYILLLTLVTAGARLRVFVLALIGWLILGLILPFPKNVPDELRITVLAVGKGGCIVMECPDGRCLVYDVGTASGPNTVSRVIAPFLWKRGISRIDELFISHADTDHFNGVSQLLNRFPVGQVTLTPSFSEKPTIEVAATLHELERAGVPKRITNKGDLFKAGKVELEVLHPPLEGPAGIENERSLVLLVSYQNHTVLLTGDLEKAGTSTLLQQAPRPVDALIAPHHGSRAALPQAVLNWCQPRFIVVSRGAPFGNTIQQGPDTKQITTWDTDTQGAVTISCHRTGVTVESFRTQERQVISRARR